MSARRPRSLRARLLLAFASVALVGGIVFAVMVRALVPTLFEGNMGPGMNGQGMNGSGMGGSGMGGSGMGGSGQSLGQQTHDAVVHAVNVAMVVALAASLLVAALLAWWLSRRTLRGFEQVRAGTAALREGNYRTQVPVPAEPELADLAGDINQLAQSLATTEQRRAALIGDVAHEMRTPLTSIAGHLEGFQDGLFSQEETVAAVTTEVARLQRLAADLAAVSRAEEGVVLTDVQRADLAALTTAVTDRLRPVSAAKGVAVDVRSEPAWAAVDVGRVEQVVTNLVANAVTYTPSGGTVTVTVAPVDGRAVVTVVDSGRGLTADELQHVFDRFYRADPADHTGGTGVGLTIARAIAEAHGGRLTAASDGLGRGATFRLELPA